MYSAPIMFHHFHGQVHPVVQGSISADELDQLLDWLTVKYQILNAGEYLWRVQTETIKDNEICLSFDDSLLCQSDVALPILDRRNIKAFFFVYSSAFCDSLNSLEIYRSFRTTKFNNINEFYSEFFGFVEILLGGRYSTERYLYRTSEHLSEYNFYTEEDRWFRFLRDQVLEGDSYDLVMRELMDKHCFDTSAASKALWMSEADIKRIDGEGHIVGLHSYSHPTAIHKLTYAQQQAEYEKNHSHLSGVLNTKPIVMSHPCGNYNNDTLEVLRRLGILVGFRSNAQILPPRSKLELPRIDHIDMIKTMNQERLQLL